MAATQYEHEREEQEPRETPMAAVIIIGLIATTLVATLFVAQHRARPESLNLTIPSHTQ